MTTGERCHCLVCQLRDAALAAFAENAEASAYLAALDEEEED